MIKKHLDVWCLKKALSDLNKKINGEYDLKLQIIFSVY